MGDPNEDIGRLYLGVGMKRRISRLFIIDAAGLVLFCSAWLRLLALLALLHFLIMRWKRIVSVTLCTYSVGAPRGAVFLFP